MNLLEEAIGAYYQAKLLEFFAWGVVVVSADDMAEFLRGYLL